MVSSKVVPAPPPPPPAPAVSSEDGSGKRGEVIQDAAGALFAQISALGEGIREGLKKATRGPVDESAGKDSTKDGDVNNSTLPKRGLSDMRKNNKAKDLGGEPNCVLAGKKWTVEYQNGRNGDDMITLETDLKQTVYIFKCYDSIVKISGKVNAIVLDNCEKTGCMFDEALASVELVNCKDVQLQCLKTAPAVSIDGCVSVCYYMSKMFQDAQIITAKSAAINLVRPTEDDGTLKILALPLLTFS